MRREEIVAERRLREAENDLKLFSLQPVPPTAEQERQNREALEKLMEIYQRKVSEYRKEQANGYAFCPIDGLAFEPAWTFCPKCGKARGSVNPAE